MDHQEEWWKVINETQEKIWIMQAECHHMDKECYPMDKEDLQDITEWIEEATVEWVIWELEATTLICHSNNNMVELQILANMVHI